MPRGIPDWLCSPTVAENPAPGPDRRAGMVGGPQIEVAQVEQVATASGGPLSVNPADAD